MWPYPHNWSSTYRVTHSYLTDILLSGNGREQRRALRLEPRRTIETSVLRDGDSARSLDRYLWTTGPEAFTHLDPVTGVLATVRLLETQDVQHPTDSVVSADITLAVEPGTDSYSPPWFGDYNSFDARLVFPFVVNWRDGVPDTLTIPRRTVDYGRGRIAVDRPVPFLTRQGTFSLVFEFGQAGVLFDFFRLCYGRQREFWLPSLLSDLKVVETVSNTLIVEGADAAAMADEVNYALLVDLYNGNRYYRRVLSASLSGGTSLLSLDTDFPDTVNAATVRRCAWVRLARFASDDMTVEWLTTTVARSQVQALTLPYAEPEDPLYGSDIEQTADYYGPRYAPTIADPLQVIVNEILPLASEWPA